MSTNADKCELKFVVSAARRPPHWGSPNDGTLYHVVIRPAYVWDGRDGRYSAGDLLTPSYSDWRDDAHTWPHLSGLEITAQCESERNDGSWYGTDVTFSASRITVKQAQTMAKVLTRVEKALASYRETYGYEAGVHVTASVVARACGARSQQPFVRYLVAGERDMDGSGKRWMTTDALGDYLREVSAGKRTVNTSTY